MYAYAVKLLKVNLSAGTFEVERLGEDTAMKFLGGAGLAGKLLQDMDWQVDPLAAENRLVFTLGPLEGTSAPFCSRYVVAAKSPLTGLWGEAHASGFWGPELKLAGWDGIIIDGKAENPVYLYINNDKVEIKDARDLWGKDTYETEDILRQKHGDKRVRVACIGPAGEKLSRMAGIFNDDRAAARCGLGAVMGSKKLKAIAVRGTGHVSLAREDEFKELVKEINKVVLASSGRTNLRKYGTNAAMAAIYQAGDVPIKNFSQGKWDEGFDKLSGPAIAEAIVIDPSACKFCPVGCGRMIREIKEGPFKGFTGPGPEYETIAAFGPLCMNDNVGAIAKANDLCNRYGLDSISAGATIAFAMECFERGIITKKDADGLELTWGNYQAMLALLEKMGKRQGIGDLLADGSKQAAGRLGEGSEEFAIHVKGLELPLHDPRAFASWALAYSTCNRGACHIAAPTYWLERGVTFPDLGYPKALDRFTAEGKAGWVKVFQDFCEAEESIVICKFSTYGDLRSPQLLRLISLATGWNIDLNDLLKIGERSFNLKRMINVKLGASRKDDTLPRRILSSRLTDGGTEGHIPDQETMLKEYYQLRGWSEDGIPTPEKLKELSL
jgi:aldehyde:ferredoxin oxidoreductase